MVILSYNTLEVSLIFIKIPEILNKILRELSYTPQWNTILLLFNRRQTHLKNLVHIQFSPEDNQILIESTHRIMLKFENLKMFCM